MNKGPLNGQAIGNGTASFKVLALAATSFVVTSAVVGVIRVGGAALTAFGVSNTSAQFTATIVANARTELKLSSATTVTMFKAVYAAASTSVSLRVSATGSLIQQGFSSVLLRLQTLIRAGTQTVISASTILGLTLKDKDVVVYGSAAPTERQMIVPQEDRTMVV